MSQPCAIPVSNTRPAWTSGAPLGVGILAALSVGWLVFSYGYIEDDAFIHLDYARSIADGQGFAFEGRVTNGDTAPLWPLLLAGLHALGLGWIAAAKLACAVGLVVAIGGLVSLLRALPVRGAAASGLLPAALAVTSLNPYFLRWSFSGMEAVTALGVAFWIIRGVFAAPASWGRLTAAAVLIGLGPLLRPELLLMGLLAGVPLLWRAWKLRSPPRLAALLGLAGVMALPLAVWIVYALHAFGSIIPNTNLAKQGAALRELAPRLASVYLAGFPVTVALLPFLAWRRLRAPSTPLAVWMLLAWPAACAMFYLFDHTIVQTRYALASMPCASIALLWLLSASGRVSWFRAAALGMSAAAILTTVLASIPLAVSKLQTVAAYSAMSTYIREHVPAGAPVAVYAIGQVAFESGHPIVDVGGITQPSVVPYMNDPRATIRWAKAQGARYIIGHDDLPEPGAQRLFATSTPYLGWTFSRSRQRASEALVLYSLQP